MDIVHGNSFSFFFRDVVSRKEKICIVSDFGNDGRGSPFREKGEGISGRGKLFHRPLYANSLTSRAFE